MKKKRINLFGSRIEYFQIEKQFYYLRILTIILFFTLIFIFIFINIKFFSDQKQLSNLINKKKVLLENQQQNLNEEAKIKIAFNKYQDIQSYLKNDANFLPYYQILISTLKTATPEPVILSFKVDKEKKTNFTLGFSDINQIIKFLDFIEEENFLNKFETLVLKGFSISESKTELTFEGRFISIKNENF